MNSTLNVTYEDLKNKFFAAKPREVDGIANQSAFYYRNWMLKKVFGRFEVKNIPANWDYDYMMQGIFIDGKITITDTDLGVLPLKCGLTGINVFNHPTQSIIANPVLGNLRRTIDEDCVVIKLQYNYHGINDMLNRYAALLSMCDSSIAVNLMNSKVAFIGMASSKAQAATMQKMYDDISCGKPAVFVKGDIVNQESFFFNHVKQNFVADEIETVKRKIVNEFLTDIGINNANQDKKERLVTDEVNANDEEVYLNVQHWYDNLTDGFNKANKMYGLNIEVKLRDYKKEEVSNESEEL